MVELNSSKPLLRWVCRGLVQFLLVTALSSLIWTSVVAQQTVEPPLTNAAVVKLVKAGFKEKTIIAIINSRPNRFNLETEQLIQLKRSGVTENVILAMLSFQNLIEVNDDEAWANEPFFRESNKQRIESDPKASSGAGGDVFGSGSSSRSSNRTRGSLGGNENDGTITGSATVRIIRPQTEGGNAAAKLEKVPTLDNDGVIRLVEAGFSEGTIIKRIENSPVEFDLAPEKLNELHKRRVTDPIIAAMSAAMGETPKPKTPQPEREN